MAIINLLNSNLTYLKKINKDGCRIHFLDNQKFVIFHRKSETLDGGGFVFLISEGTMPLRQDIPRGAYLLDVKTGSLLPTSCRIFYHFGHLEEVFESLSLCSFSISERLLLDIRDILKKERSVEILVSTPKDFEAMVRRRLMPSIPYFNIETDRGKSGSFVIDRSSLNSLGYNDYSCRLFENRAIVFECTETGTFHYALATFLGFGGLKNETENVFQMQTIPAYTPLIRAAYGDAVAQAVHVVSENEL